MIVILPNVQLAKVTLWGIVICLRIEGNVVGETVFGGNDVVHI